MSKIQVLDNFISEQIAAGEVIERPSSVIKELVENAIDAKAHNITIEIKNGGTTYMRISDDGIGMSKEDAQKCVLRHATSKIKCLNDLFSIDTLGFRGEALASICVVSKLQIITKTKDNLYGSNLYFEGGKLESIEESGCPDGTTIIVRDLFYNTPARMKFLKKDSSESSKVQNVVEKIALSKPEISFNFIKDDVSVFQTNGNGDLKECIYSILGKEISNNITEVSYELNGIKVEGYTSLPITVRGNRGLELFFVNGRYITTKMLSIAVEQAYRNLIMKGKYPICILNIYIDSSKIDVNVHPSKLEAKFSDEKMVFDAIYFGCKNALNGKDYLSISNIKSENTGNTNNDNNTVNSDNVFNYRFFNISEEKNIEKEIERDIKPYIQSKLDNIEPKMSFSQNIIENDVAINVSHIPYSKNIILENKIDNIQTVNTPNGYIADEDIPSLLNYNPTKNNKVEDESIEETKSENTYFDSNNLIIVGEAFKTYIIFQINDKIYILDKHAAHERIIFNKLKTMDLLKDVQQMFVPAIIDLSSYDYDIFINNEDIIKDIGFICEQFGNQSIKISSVPIFLMEKNIKDIFLNCLSEIDKNRNSDKNSILDTLLHTMACRSAVKAGDFTSNFEMKKFVEKVIFDDNVRFCPHGRPCIREFNRTDLEKLFKRIV